MNATVLDGLWWAAAALGVAGASYLLLALAAVAAWRPRPKPAWARPPRVVLLKPLCGLEQGLEGALHSFLSQRVSSPLVFVFGVADGADPALALAREVAARHPRTDCRFVVGSQIHGPNPKVSNLINMARAVSADREAGDVVILSDSDTLIGPGVLQRAIDALAAPGVGAVTALYRACPGIAGDRMRSFGAWFLDYWFLPMATLHARLAPLSVTYGPLTAVRGDLLARIGGLPALANNLSDDAELGRLIRAAGYTVAFSPDPVETLVNDSCHRELFEHELRWSRTVRGLDPAGFFASLVSHPGPLPLLLLLRPGWVAAVGLVAPIVLRWLLAVTVERRFGRSPGLRHPGPLGLWLRDCYCFAVWTAAAMVGRVGWRGQRLAVHSGDILAPVATQR
jgi:ceramide glucosyltransferase